MSFFLPADSEMVELMDFVIPPIITLDEESGDGWIWVIVFFSLIFLCVGGIILYYFFTGQLDFCWFGGRRFRLRPKDPPDDSEEKATRRERRRLRKLQGKKRKNKKTKRSKKSKKKVYPTFEKTDETEASPAMKSVQEQPQSSEAAETLKSVGAESGLATAIPSSEPADSPA